MKRRTVQFVAGLILVALIAGVVLALRSQPQPIVQQPTATPVLQPSSPPTTQTPTSAPTAPPPRPRIDYTPVPADTISPMVVQRSPARGEDLSPGGAIELVFDRAMDHAATEASFRVTPAVQGKLQWANERTLRFEPAQALPRAALYDVVLDQGAKAADGAPINGAYQFRFATAGYLEIGQVIPADGTQQVQASAAITVLFNRPVVPLTVVEQQSSAPQPLSFEPAIAGTGEWLNTAIYVFHPAAPLAGGTSYTGRIAAGLSAIDGSPLQSDYRWSFTVARPEVVFVTPQDSAEQISVKPTITLQFNQPIDPASARAAFHLRHGSDVPGDLQVLSGTLIFTPSQQLEFDRSYDIVADAGLGGSAGGAGLERAFHSAFRTVPLPRILGTTPADGDSGAQPYTDFAIQFNAPIEPATVMPNLQMVPPISPTQVYTSFNTYDNTFHLSFGAKPSSEYLVRIGPKIADPYGNLTGEELTVRFRTSPLPASAQILSPGWVATYSAQNPARVGLSSVNTSSASLRLYRLSADDLKQVSSWASQLPAGAQLLRSWTESISAPLDQQTLSRVDLVEGGGRLDPGVYMLQLDLPNNSTPQMHVLVVSNINATLKSGERTALVWANDLQSGQPVPNIPLQFFDSNGGALGSASTDSSGVAQISIDRTQNQGVIALSSQPFVAVSSDWGAGGGDLPLAYDLPELTAHVYTDRPIYRPGQTVDFKGVLRAEDDVKFSLPANLSTVQATIRSASGEQVYQQTLQLGQNGTFDGSLKLADGAALGSYDINVLAGSVSFDFPFQVAAYRAPEFQVAVTPPAGDIVRGTAASLTAEVTYFFGGPVASAPVQWNVVAEPYRFAPDWAARYSFENSDDPWRCWECWWAPVAPPQPILSGSGSTDAQGHLKIDLPAQLKDSSGVPITDSVRLMVEASVTGKDNQVISGRHELIVHSGQLYIGLAPQRYVGQAGEEQKIDLVSTDTQGARLASQTIDVAVLKYSWDNRFVQDASGGGHWEWSQQQTQVATQTVTTNGSGAATIAFTPADAGSYRVQARARDAGGREVRSSLFVWIAGSAYASWRRDDTSHISLIADKTRYKVGETATILIPSPFQQPHWALITVERGNILSHEVRRMEGNSAVYRLPLTDAHVPNVFVSVVLFSAPDAPGRPADFKVGSLPLTVAPDPQTLRITLSPSLPQAEPGAKVDYAVTVTDQAGNPVAADLSLDLVDKAVLSLMPRTPDAIREAFYGRRGLNIATASGLVLSADRLQEQLEQELERQQRERQNSGAFGSINDGLTSAAPMPAASEAAPMPQAQDRMAAGGEAAQADAPSVREQFADTAYWNAHVTTDASGHATVQVTLPDNLTTWTMRGVGLTADTRVGEGTADLVATKPLLIRPVTPRFFVVGDRAELAANVSNQTAAPLEVQVSLATRGLTVTGQITQTVQVPANGETQVTWQAQAQDVESADLVFSAVSGSYGDASRPRLATGPAGTLPVYRYSAPEIVGTGGQIESAGSRTESIGLPPNIDPRSGELTVRIDPSLAAGMRDGLSYLEHYEYECTEQTISRFLPNVLTMRALKKLGVANPELEARLPGLVNEGLDKLYSQQRQDGGWGWWSGDESNPHISAYVVFGMLRAKEAGFSVHDDALSRGLDYLAGQLSDTGAIQTAAQANRQAWLLYVLGEGDRSDTTRLGQIYDAREKLSTYARAFLALALQKSGAQSGDARLKTLLSDLNNAAILSATGAHWEEQENDWWSMNTDTRSTAIVLDALVRLDPKNQINPNVVRWLMVARKDGIWETTQESAWALIALTDWMEYTGELKANYDYALWLNEKEQVSGHIGQDDLQKPIVLSVKVADLLRDTGNKLTFGRGAGDGRLYYTAHLRAFLPVEQIKSLDRGVTVRRRYTLASCQDGPKCPEVTQTHIGDVLRVELEIVAPSDLYYLAVEDPLPAGAEAIDTGLATTSQIAAGPSLQRGPVMPIEDGAAARAPVDIYWPWWNWYSRSELRDEKVALFADHLPRGSYLYSYTMRVTLAGDFHVIPTTARELYFPEVYGRADGQLLRVGN